MKILITGGHLTPALAIIEYLQERNLNQIIFVGRKSSIEGSKIESQEYLQIKEKNIPFIPIITGRIQRTFTKYTLASLLKIPYGFIQSIQILLNEKPQCILSFGGYVAVPVCITAWCLGIPVFTHEQTGELGLSNKIISHFAKNIFLSWPNQKYDNKPKYVVTGNPIRKAVFTVNSNDFPKEFIDEQVPLIYITGGSQGSESINRVVLECLPSLLEKVKIIHQIGQNLSIKTEIDQIINSVDDSLKKRYLSFGYIDGSKIGWILHNSVLVIGRSGANTVSELIALRKKALLIPLPWAGNNEQEENAQIMKDLGLAKIIEQKDLNKNILNNKIIEMIETENQRKNGSEEIKIEKEKNSAKIIIDIITATLQK